MAGPPSFYCDGGLSKVERFKAWLVKRGAEIRRPLPPNEILRIETEIGLVVAITNEKLAIYWPERALRLWALFDAETSTAGIARTTIPTSGGQDAGSPTHPDWGKSAQRLRVINSLLARDGSDCFFCLNALGDDITIEHLCPKSKGGAESIANKALAHERCNTAAGALSVMEKVRIREAALLRKLQRSRAA